MAVLQFLLFHDGPCICEKIIPETEVNKSQILFRMLSLKYGRDSELQPYYIRIKKFMASRVLFLRGHRVRCTVLSRLF